LMAEGMSLASNSSVIFWRLISCFSSLLEIKSCLSGCKTIYGKPAPRRG
jgi:hypothetical protein